MRAQLLALALLSAACSHRTNQASSEATPEQENAKTTVKVDNQTPSTMTVYVLSAISERLRLGQVNGLSTEVFTIPDFVVRLSTQVRFEIRAIGDRGGPRTQTITIVPGDQVELTIPPM